jgi:hypothetical protein
VHRRIGVPQNLAGIPRVLGAGDDAETGTQAHGGDIDADRLREGAADLAEDRLRIPGVRDAGLHQREVGATEPGQQVAWSDERCEPSGDLLQDPVPVVVAEGIVHVAEVVDVDADGDDGAIVPAQLNGLQVEPEGMAGDPHLVVAPEPRRGAVDDAGDPVEGRLR